MRRLLERTGHLVFVLWAVASLSFLLFRLTPGDPTLNFLTPTFTEETRAALMRSFGLDRPLWQQYGIYLAQLARGDLGMSFLQGRSVLSLLLEALPNTLVLTLVSVTAAYAIGIVAGAFLAFRRGDWIEAVAIPSALAARSAPEFWLGMLLLTALAFQTGWFPTGGALSPGAPDAGFPARLLLGDFWWHLALPALTLVLYLLGLPLLMMRATMLEVLGDEFITLARMKGLGRWSVVIRHAARNALLPVATAFALGLGTSIGANVVIETVFGWPGIGRLLVNAVQGADYPLAQGAFLMIAAVLVLMNTVADLAYAALDPRVSVGARR